MPRAKAYRRVYAEFAPRRRLEGTDGFFGLPQGLNERSCLLKEDAPRLGKTEAPRCAIEQAATQARFQRLYVLADHRTRHFQLGGSGRKAAARRYAQENFDTC